MRSFRFFKPFVIAGLVNSIAKQASADTIDPLAAHQSHSRYWTKDGLPTKREKQCKERFDMFFLKETEALAEFHRCMQEAQWKDQEDYFAMNRGSTDGPS